MYVLYKKFANVVDEYGEPIYVTWLTARHHEMAVPGGMCAVGTYDHNNTDELVLFGSDNQIKDIVAHFLRAFDRAAMLASERKRIMAEEGKLEIPLLFDLMDHIKAETLKKDNLFVFAFREFEAGIAVLEAGYAYDVNNPWPVLKFYR